MESFTDRYDRILNALNYDGNGILLEEELLRLQDPEIWNDSKKAIELNKHVSELQSKIKLFEDFVIDFEILKERLKEHPEDVINISNELESLLESTENHLILSNSEDKSDAILTISAGAGGTEAQDWTRMLCRMYEMYCKRNNYSFDIISSQKDEISGGFKSVTIEIKGENAFGLLKVENGVHRLIRVSPFNAQGKRMTSFAAVSVIPLIDNSINIVIDKSKLSYDTFRSGGAGGQNVNKVESGVRLHYKFINPLTNEEDEIVIENTETRDQPKNKANAERILKSKLYDLELKKRKKIADKIEDDKSDNEWGNQIRSYILDDKRVKDHRTGYEEFDTDSVLNGNIDEFIRTYLLRTI